MMPDQIVSQVRLFADDTAVYLTMEGGDSHRVLQNDLDNLSIWKSRWDMEFNPSKCQVQDTRYKNLYYEFSAHIGAHIGMA